MPLLLITAFATIVFSAVRGKVVKALGRQAVLVDLEPNQVPVQRQLVERAVVMKLPML